MQVYSIFEENNTAYMVMEFVQGKTLQKLVDTRGPLPEKEVVGYITQAADALNAVHEANVLHRDIKPDNLMVTQDGRVVLVDFGTARAFASGKAKHMTAMLTPGYAPPDNISRTLGLDRSPTYMPWVEHATICSLVSHQFRRTTVFSAWNCSRHVGLTTKSARRSAMPLCGQWRWGVTKGPSRRRTSSRR